MVGVAQADHFTDTLTWSGDGHLITEKGGPFTYQHDLLLATPSVDIPGGDVVTEADLTLTFKDDYGIFGGGEGDEHGWFIIFYDNREYVKVAFDGGSWVDITDEVDTGSYPLAVDIDWLNDDGLLDVTVAVWNPLGTADVYLKSSTLGGEFTPIPVPGAILLGILGLGAAGLKLRRFA